jgi:hypothetical protein
LAAKENELKQMSFVTLVIDVMTRCAKWWRDLVPIATVLRINHSAIQVVCSTLNFSFAKEDSNKGLFKQSSGSAWRTYLPASKASRFVPSKLQIGSKQENWYFVGVFFNIKLW